MLNSQFVNLQFLLFFFFIFTEGSRDSHGSLVGSLSRPYRATAPLPAWAKSDSFNWNLSISRLNRRNS